jgi:hypothetical protein
MKNFFKKIKFVASAALALVLCFGGLTYADSTEIIFETDKDCVDFGELSELGRSYTQNFTMRNHSDVEQKVVASVAAYENGNVSNDFKIADEWLTFVDGKNEYTVPAGGESVVNVRVHLPNTVKAGTYYASVKLNLESETFKTIDVRLDILGEGFSKTGSLGGNYARLISFGCKIQAGATVKNTGNAGSVRTYTLKKGEAFGLEHFQDIISTCESLRPTLNVFMILHSEDVVSDNSIVEYKVSTIGKMLDNQYNPIEVVPMVLYSSVIYDDKGAASYGFYTHRHKEGTIVIPAKTPDGMFEEEFIPNDLQLVVNKMNEYYG